MHRAVISGVTGYLGRELARQLVNEGIEVHGLTRQTLSAVSQTLEGVRLHQLDHKTETLIAVLCDVRPDATFHLAALARREHRTGDVAPFVNSNILLGTQLLEAARQVGCRRFIAAGSYLQYAQNGAYRAYNLYAATKQAFENILALL
jgi:nucleoside-diphosphate-sugar epimerase